jgi:hypothetical protein
MAAPDAAPPAAFLLGPATEVPSTSADRLNCFGTCFATVCRLPEPRHWIVGQARLRFLVSVQGSRTRQRCLRADVSLVGPILAWAVTHQQRS